jgi:diacylglycerol O-acyltransferase / wax synthase
MNVSIFPYVTTSIFIIAVGWLQYVKHKQKLNSGKSSSSSKSSSLPRRASFTSLGLALGTFPVEANVPETIVNTACYFNCNDLPSVDAIVNEIIKPLLKQHERMKLVLDTKTGYFRPTSTPYEPKDLLRILEISCSDESTLNQTIFDHCQDSLIEYGTSRPWWEILVVQNNGKGPSALVIRVHHALADGISLVHAFAPLLKPKTKNEKTTMNTAVKATDNVPSSTRNYFIKLILNILEGTFHVLTLGLSKYDDKLSFSKCNHGQMKHSGKRDFVILPTTSLEFIKKLKKAGNCTVNTIIMTAISQALHDYCLIQKDVVLVDKGSDVQCRALLPVGFQRSKVELSDPRTTLINKWCLISCNIFVGYDDINLRLNSIHEAMTQIKHSSRAYMQLLIQNTIAPLLPRRVARQTVMDIMSRHSFVLTNVPGHGEICLMAGKPVSAVQVFFNNLLTQVDIVSYAGNVYGNVVYDPNALSDFQTFGLLYAKALILLAERLGVQPPDDLLTMSKGSTC